MVEGKILISIITPVYNVEKYLPQCIDSVIAQTFSNWELILVDDGSTDRSGAICDEYAAKDTRIRVLHKENSGQADSRNIALRMARADLIGYLDSDDWIEPDMYEVLYNTMMETGSDISVCGYFMSYINRDKPSCTGDEVTVYDRTEALELILRDRKMKNFLWDKLYRKKVITADMPRSFCYEDYATLVKWFASSNAVSVCERPEYHYRQRKGSTDHDVNPVRKWHFFLAEKERCSFIMNSGMLPHMDKELETRIVKAGVSQAKDMARCRDRKTAARYMETIRAELATYGSYTPFQIGMKSWWRLVVLRFSIPIFARLMQLSGVLVLSRFGKDRIFYE